MKVYSENIHLFLLKCEQQLKHIIANETNLVLRRSRFEYNRYTYPIHIVIFEGENKLGFFDPHTYQIGLNINLMYMAKENVISDILRHELAHYICYLKYGNQIKAHGVEFKQTCLDYGWDKSISKAGLDIEQANNEKVGNLASEKLISKVKALLKLAQSENKHEAELATLKANELLLKHNLKYYALADNDKKIYSQNLITSKRKSAKLTCIYDILKHFMVRPVFIYGKDQVALEVSGTLANVELAEYVCTFLERELEAMWNETKSTTLKGTKAKNSFFHGIARGYGEKMQGLKKQMQPAQQNALVLIEKDLDHMMNKIYRRLSHTGSNASFDSNAYGAGKDAGKNLTINQAVKSSKTLGGLLNWSKS